MSWFQARWSSSEGASAATWLPGRGKTPHWVPSGLGGLIFGASAANAMATEASAAAAIAIVVRTSIGAAYAAMPTPRAAPPSAA